MATVRVEKLANYTTLSNRHIDDSRLSLKAVGLLTYMLRLPDDWDFTLEWLARKHKDGLSSIRSAMAELEEAGYVIRGDQRRDNRGTFLGSDYIVREDPDGNRPVTACENRTRTACENPISGFPISENRTQPITKEPSTKKPKPPKAPQGAEGDIWDPEAFERFWQIYPKKKDKKSCIKEWNKLRADRNLMRIMAAALRRQMVSEEWLRDNGRAIPYPCRWISHRRWEDDPDVALPSAAPAEEAIVWL